MNKPIADISQWQGDVDYNKLTAMTDGVIIRAGHGTAPDANFAENWSGLALHPGIFGVYWFVSSWTNGGVQAQLFDETLSWRTFDFLVADFEENGAGLSQSSLRARYKLFLDTLAALRPGADIRIYTRKTFWDPMIGVAGWEKNHKLWVAHYGAINPAIPLAWNGDYWLHQYSADGNNLGALYGVESDDIDLNKLAIPVPPPPTPPPATTLPRLVVLTNNLSIRAAPTVPAWPNNYTAPPLGNLLGKLAAGTVIDVTELYVETAARVWARHAAGWSAVVYGGNIHMEETP